MSEMNQTVRTTLEHINMPIPKEPCTYLQAGNAKDIAYDNNMNSIQFRIKGDKFSGKVVVNYYYDFYQIEFWKVRNGNAVMVKDIEGVFGSELAQYLWNETFIV